MSTSNTQRTSSRIVRLLLIATSAAMIAGCQTPAYRRHPQRVQRPHSCNTYTSAPGNSCGCALTHFASARPQFSEESQAAGQMSPIPEATPAEGAASVDAADMFRTLRGKLRADGNGAIVEADLSFSDVTDEALSSIDQFPEIKELDLTGTQVHDDSLVVLQHLPNLQSLKLKGTQISSLGFQSLTQIPTLVLLDASNTRVADDGLAQASLWKNLRYLSLNNTGITDAAVPQLTSIGTLKGLSLLNTKVTSEGAQKLKEALPDCLIVTKTDAELNPSAAIDSLKPVPSQSGVAFPNLLSTSDPQLEQLVELSRKQPQLAVHLSSVYSNREQWSQAARVLSAAAEADPSLQLVQFSLGIALARSGDTVEARAHLTKAVGEAAANYNLGQIEYENSLRACAAHFRQAVAADPSLTKAQNRLHEVQHELAALKQERTPVHAATFSSSLSADPPLEVIPAPPVRPAGLSRSWPR
jgi:tetratricopeptide (TPR) repeat protein